MQETILLKFVGNGHNLKVTIFGYSYYLPLASSSVSHEGGDLQRDYDSGYEKTWQAGTGQSGSGRLQRESQASAAGKNGT